MPLYFLWVTKMLSNFVKQLIYQVYISYIFVPSLIIPPLLFVSSFNFILLGVSLLSHAFRIRKFFFLILVYRKNIFQVIIHLRLGILLLMSQIYLSSINFFLTCQLLKLVFSSTIKVRFVFKICIIRIFNDLFIYLEVVSHQNSLFFLFFCFYKFYKVTIVPHGKSSANHLNQSTIQTRLYTHHHNRTPQNTIVDSQDT